MKISRYSILFNKIPRIKYIIKNKILNSQDMECLENIYIHYKNSDKNQKAELRKLLRAKRDLISESELKTKSLVLTDSVINLKEFKEANTIFCYISFGKEIDTFNILNYCINYNKNLCVPLIIKDIMIPCKIKDLANLKRNKYGILEPTAINKVKINSIDLAIVPGLGFNPLGYRIGYGGGYYDRFLKKFNGYSIGMALKDFTTTKIIPDKFDQPVCKVIIL